MNTKLEQHRRERLNAHVAFGALVWAVSSAVCSPVEAAAGTTSIAPNPAGSTVAEVIVTATRRNEALQNVPIAVTAVTGEAVKSAHIDSVQDLPSSVPGLSFVSIKGPSTENVQIRGQTTTNDAPGLELPVAVFIDDIYYGTLASFDANFFDVAQIAVLRGPQGTTFGRNVVGGALQITSNMPHLGVTSGEIDGTVSSYFRHGSVGGETQGFLNVPINETLAGRIAFSAQDVGGYTHNVLTGHNLNDIKTVSVRPSLLWEPTPDLKLTAFLSYTHEDDYGPGYGLVGQGAIVAISNSHSPWDSFQDVDGSNKRNIFAGQVKGELHRTFGDFTSITSYRSLRANQIDDGDGGPFAANYPSINRSKEFGFSQEFRFTSPAGQRLEYLGGLYFSFENIYKAITFGFEGTNPNSYLYVLTHDTYQLQTPSGDSHTRTIAPYAEFKFHATKQFALTVGARYTAETKSGYTEHDGFSFAYGNPYDVQLGPKTWEAFTPRAIAEYKPAEGALFYASVSKGFKGGGWSLAEKTPQLAVIALEPEKNLSYELGTKLQLFERRLTLDVAAFQADTKDAQVRTFVNGALNDSNAGKIRDRGVEVEGSFRPWRAAEIGVNYAYNHAIYLQFVGCTSATSDCSGSPVALVPRNDVTIFGNYNIDLGEAGALNFHADAQWASKYDVTPQRTDAAGVAAGPIQPYAKAVTGRDGFVNAWLTYAPHRGSWTAQLWAKNLLNRKSMGFGANYYFDILSPAEVAAHDNEVSRGVYSPPQQFGVTVRYKF